MIFDREKHFIGKFQWQNEHLNIEYFETIENEEEWWTEEIKRLSFNRNVRIFFHIKCSLHRFIPIVQSIWNGCEKWFGKIVFAIFENIPMFGSIRHWKGIERMSPFVCIHSVSHSQKKWNRILRKGDSSLLNGFHLFLFISRLNLNHIDMNKGSIEQSDAHTISYA